MTRKVYLYGLSLSIAFQLLLVPTAASAAEGLASLNGLTMNLNGYQPVSHALVTALNINRGERRSTYSGANGSFYLAKLEPGLYQLAVEHDGYAGSTATVEISSAKTYKVDLVLKAEKTPPAQVTGSSPGGISTPVSGLADEIAALKARIGQLESGKKSSAASEPVETASAAMPEGAMPQAGAPAAQTPPAAPAAAPPAAAPSFPDALMQPPPSPSPDNDTPFAYADFTWLNGTSRNTDEVLATKWFTPEVRFDTLFIEDFNQPVDHSMGGSTEMFRSGEFQLEQISVGGDFRWQNVRGRVLYMDGLFATTTPRNDASAAVGQWDLKDAYRYVSEAWGGYSFNVNHGLNIDAGIFVSYIGLFSYYNFDNWTYQPSYVSSNTPWFFNGVRIQWFPTNKLKIEPWIINGWQSYAKYNGHRGLGGQILYRPYEWLSLVFNNYGNGTDDLGIPGRSRIHADYSYEVRWYHKPDAKGLSKAAVSLTTDAGCEYGAGVTCHGGKGGPKQSFLGWMAYSRYWFSRDHYAVTFGGGQMNNPGRYLTLLPPINGATAASGTPYFTENPGDPAKMWDANVNFQWMPKQYITWWAEAGYRHSNVPYWSGRDGITPPAGNTAVPGDYVCSNGNDAGSAVLGAAEAACGGGIKSLWFPDLRHGQASISAGVLVKF